MANTPIDKEAMERFDKALQNELRKCGEALENYSKAIARLQETLDRVKDLPENFNGVKMDKVGKGINNK